MKKISLVLLAFFGLTTMVLAQSAEKKDGPEITFEEKEYDFGDITQGDVVEHVFNFENTGNQPLILSNVLTTCGCTAPDWSREPIAPGEESKITVKFNSRGKMGSQSKNIRIVSNIGEERSIKITANVLPKDSK